MKNFMVWLDRSGKILEVIDGRWGCYYSVIPQQSGPMYLGVGNSRSEALQEATALLGVKVGY